MGNILIKKVTYIGDNFYYESPEFDSGVNIIEGVNGSGKTTLMNLIYYSLSGDVKNFNKNKNNKEKHKEITSDTNNYVELDIIISGERYLLRRSIGKNFITTSDSSGNLEAFSINRNESPIIFSDWLLNKLNINVLDIFQGNNSFKLNIKDLFRLIYHDQNPDPKKIYKSPDNESFISDSEYVRKLIFQVLLGKGFEKYYSSIGKLKEAENQRSSALSIFKEFEKLSNQLYPNEKDIMNLEFLKNRIKLFKEQLSKLSNARELLKVSRPSESDSAWKQIDKNKSGLINIELDLQQLTDNLNAKRHEQYKYEVYRDGIIKEVTQLKKIIHAHETLDVFKSNSCPFCLNVMDRKKNECYCGCTIDEDTFEKFFFSTDEYWSLLKSRKKSVETADLVIESVLLEKKSLEKEYKALTIKSQELKTSIKNALSKVDRKSIDINKLNEIDDKSLEVKNELQVLNKKLDFEEQLKQYKDTFEIKDAIFKNLDREIKILELKANSDMQSIIKDFNLIYNSLMMATLKKLRSAKIDSESYEPIVDEGVYREASSRVSIRFNYYLSMLKMALNDESVKFPNFLLIDTPQTAGIDTEELKKLISQFNDIDNINYQVILTTGLDLYPATLKNKVRETLTDDDMLLKPIIT